MIKRRRFSEDIADSVLEKVIEMGLKPGDRLPTHSRLSEMLGVSLPSLREGLSLLSLSGVINITHGAGTTLANPGPEDYFKMLSPVSRINGTDMKELSDFCSLFIYDLANIAIEKTESVHSLLKPLVQNNLSKDRGSFIHFHKEFHTTLASFMENPLKKSAFLIALNLFYTHPSIIHLSSSVLQLYLDSHIVLMESLKTGIKQEVEDALAVCYRFQAPKEEKVSILYDSFGTGSLGGSFYSMAKRFSELLMEGEGINIHLELTGGGIENVELMEEGKTILALTQSDVADAAFRGGDIFKREYPYLRVICGVKPLDLWIITTREMGLHNLSDLKGRRIAMGASGGDSSIITGIILRELGYDHGDYRAYYLSISNALQGLAGDEIDVVFYLSSEMPSAVKELSEKKKLNFLSVPGKIQEKLEKQSSFWKQSIIPVSVSGTRDIPTISVSTLLITDSRVSDDLICRITSILKNKSDDEDQISFSPDSIGVDIPFHSGVLECLK